MAQVSRPPHGRPYKISKAGYIDGLFYAGGQRLKRALGRLEDLERAPSGRRRTEKQVHAAIMDLWEGRRAALEAELDDPPGETVRMSALFEAWIADARGEGRDRDTIRARELCRDYYLRIVGDHQVEEELTDVRRRGYALARAEAFREGLRELVVPRGNHDTRRLSPARINTHLGLLRSALRYAEQRYWLTRAPEIPRVKQTQAPRRVPKPEHVKEMRKRLVALSRDKSNKRDRYYHRLHRLLFYTLLLTSMRGGEPLGLRPEHIDLDQRALLLAHTKTGKPRIVRFGPFLAGKLRAHMAAHPNLSLVFEHYTRANEPAWGTVAEASKAMRRHMEEVGISGAYQALRGYRAGYATAGLNDISLPPTAIRDQLGHSDLQTTLNYYVAGLQDAQLAAVDAMEARLLHAQSGRKLAESG